MKVAKKVFFIVLMIWMLFNIKSYASTGTINTEGARMRREPNTSSDVLTIVYNGEKVELIEKSGEWYKVKYADNVGYIREDLLTASGDIEETNKQPEKVVQPENPSEKENESQLQENKFLEIEKQISLDSSIRILPSISASIIGELKAGEKVTVIQVKNAWSCIKYKERLAWVPACFLTEVVEQPKQPETKTGYVNVSGAIIRRGPSTSAEIITEWSKNKPVEIVGEDGDWYKLNFNGEEAYVAKRLISDTVTSTSRNLDQVRQLDTKKEEPKETVAPVATNTPKLESNTSSSATSESQLATSNTNLTTGEEIVSLAKKYLGCGYVYGGSGPKSFDCSGFTQYIYKQFGITLAHSAVTQANNGTYVEKAKLQLGDLVIFRDWDNSSIGHCGIYIGGGNFIHAANSKRGVVTDTLNSGYYYERYVSGRRLF